MAEIHRGHLSWGWCGGSSSSSSSTAPSASAHLSTAQQRQQQLTQANPAWNGSCVSIIGNRCIRVTGGLALGVKITEAGKLWDTLASKSCFRTWLVDCCAWSSRTLVACRCPAAKPLKWLESGQWHTYRGLEVLRVTRLYRPLNGSPPSDKPTNQLIN